MDNSLIKRQDAIDAIRSMQTYKMFAGDDLLLVDQAGAQTELMHLPSAQPEQRWIPCSERLPEDGQIVLISQTYGWTEFEEGTEVTVAQFKRGYFTWYRYQADWNKHTSQMHCGDICPGIEYVDAWMPLPSPYTQE